MTSRQIAYPFLVQSVSLILSALIALSPSQRATKIVDQKLVGNWAAVRFSDTSIPVKDRVSAEQAALPWNYVHILPNHRFEAMFTLPLEGTWVVKGSTVVLTSKSMTNENSGIGIKIKLDPIGLTFDKEGKLLTRRLGTQTIVFGSVSVPVG